MQQEKDYIIRMKRSETKGSGSPMWRCETRKGERVNIFEHADPLKDSSMLFKSSGWFELMSDMIYNQERTFNNYPIPVTMQKDGKWWGVVEVDGCPPGAEPDPVWTPDVELYREYARRSAVELLKSARLHIIDTETTGTDTHNDEIISIAVIDRDGEQLLNQVVQPTPAGLDRFQRNGETAQAVHGITPDRLRSAPTFQDIYPDLASMLEGSIWLAYNASFDVAMLDRACLLNVRVPVPRLATVCAMQLYAAYHGTWNPVHQNLTSHKLANAAAALGVPVTDTHDALADVRLTREVLYRMAAGAEIHDIHHPF